MQQSRPGQQYYWQPDLNRDQGRLFSTAFKTQQATIGGLTMLAVQLILPVTAGLIARFDWASHRQPVIYIAGFLVTTSAYLVCSNLLPVRGYSSLKQQLAGRMSAAGIDVKRLGGIWVGFSPDGEPRIYQNNYDWDVGFLFVFPDRLCFLGEQTQFALPKIQIDKVRLGPGGPSWWGLRRVYVDWREDGGTAIRSLNFRPADARSMRQIGPESRRLLDRLLRWRVSPSDPSTVPSELAALTVPRIGAIESKSPSDAASAGRLIFLSCYLLLMSAMISFFANLPFNPAKGGQALYVLAVVFSVLVLQMGPYIMQRRPAS